MSIAEKNRLMNGGAPKVAATVAPVQTKKQAQNDDDLFKNSGFGAINLEEAKAEGRKPLELCRNHRRSYIKIEPTVKVDQAKVK